MPERVTNFLIISRCSVYLLKEKINFETRIKKNEWTTQTYSASRPASQPEQKKMREKEQDRLRQWIYIQQQRFCPAQISWTCVKIRINKSLINAKSQIKVTNQKSKAFNSKAAHRMCVWAVIVFNIKYYECMIYSVYFFFFSSIFFRAATTAAAVIAHQISVRRPIITNDDVIIRC